MPIPFYHPKPKPPAVFNGIDLPQNKANPISRAVFHWVSPILSVGYSRPLQAEDLWTLTEDLQCQNNADELEGHYMLRLPPSKRISKFKPSIESSTTVGVKSANSTTVSFGDVEKGGLPLAKEELQVADAAAEEEAVVTVIDDLAGGLGAVKLEGDAEGTTLDRPIPEGQTANDLSMAEKKPDASGTGGKKSDGKEGVKLDPEDVKRYGKRKAKKIAEGDLVMEGGKAYDMSVVRAMYSTVWLRWWMAILFYACGSLLQITAPLLTRKIINQLTLAGDYDSAVKAGTSTSTLSRPGSIGYGIGLAVALFVMEIASSLFTYQAQQRGAVIGFLMRASLIDLISRKSMRLSGKSRIEMTNGRLTTMVSADASFLDFAAPMTLSLVVQPVQILVGIGLLIGTLGYSALVGLLILILATPLQGHMFVRMITYRQAQMKIVDTRVRLLSEIINNIRAVKLYAYEVFFGEKVSKLRRQELAKLRRNGLNRSTMTATMSFIPVLAAVLTFITYSLSGHALNPAIIFSSLQYFNVLKQPITFLPMAFTAVSDAAVAVGRIGTMLRAHELKREINIDRNAKYSIDVEGDFQFDSASPPDQTGGGRGGGRRGGRGGRDRAGAKEDKKKAKKEKKEAKARTKQGLPPIEAPPPKKDDGIPFSLRDVALKIPRGSLVCIVGRVGTGKTALLLGLINEMQQLHGHVVFGGPVSYVPQQAWVQSGSIRDNITFSSEPEHVNKDRVNEIIDACALRPECDMWPDGDLTKIGEKGITLSGGQRQRICLARAAYDEASEIVLLDDPLSAVDAHVGHHLLQNCILRGPLSGKTRVLVTHQLDVLPQADIVLVLDRDTENRGQIIQHGTYAALREEEGVFRTLMEEFGSSSEGLEAAIDEQPAKMKKSKTPTGGGGKLLLDEERETGAVSWRVYAKYGQAMGSWSWVGLCAAMLCLTQAATVGNSLFLGFWSGSEIHGFRQGDYMAIYACLGVASAVFTWSASYTMILAGIRASFALFDGAWKAVMRSPIGWHDRTPTGRIINRLSKDIEMLDDRLSQVWNQLLSNALSVVGTFALVVYSFPYLGLVFIPLGVLYYMAASYYRQTSREVKRIDSISRSAIYSSFGEQLAGLAVIRAFGQQDNFEKRLQHSVNFECQAYILTITLQRWLGVRLDFLSYTLVLLISIFGSVFRNSVSPSKLGVVLTYALSAASVFSNLVQLFAQVEQEMNNVERVQYYNDLQIEADARLPTDPGPEWPPHGELQFQDVQMRYRPDLPLVLDGLTFHVNPGEKVGIIGRTGAGKSSIAQALFRTVELCGGKISVDGRDLRGVGLDTVRSQLAIIPQDTFLFGGTVRDNVDPTGSRSDAELAAALDLIHANSNSRNSGTLQDKFQLDATVLNEGANFSAGERQLLALVRALARGCKVLLLDEATSSVDPETDAIIQRIIQTKFSDVTLISIAHRLQTVAYYDRILVMDAGKIAEFDSPLALFDNPDSAFRSLCDTKRLNRQDLLKIQKDAAASAAAASKSA